MKTPKGADGGIWTALRWTIDSQLMFCSATRCRLDACDHAALSRHLKPHSPTCPVLGSHAAAPASLMSSRASPSPSTASTVEPLSVSPVALRKPFSPRASVPMTTPRLSARGDVSATGRATSLATGTFQRSSSPMTNVTSTRCGGLAGKRGHLSYASHIAEGRPPRECFCLFLSSLHLLTRLMSFLQTLTRLRTRSARRSPLCTR